MLTKNKKSYNHLLIQLKQKENITAEKLAEVANVNLATLNAWLASPNTKKWRRLDKERFYLIKSRLYFCSQTSLDKKYSIRDFLHNIDMVLNIARKSALSGKPITGEELKFIDQAKEMNQLLAGSIFDLIPPDQQENDFIESLKQEDYSEDFELEEEFYRSFLSSINKKEVLDLHYKEKQSPLIIAITLNFPIRFIERLIHEDQERNYPVIKAQHDL